MRYRIAPYGVDGWKVQSRVWWLPFWADETQWVGYQTFVVRWFAQESDAEKFIESRLESVRLAREEKAAAKDRERRYAPRVYPTQ